MVLKTTLHARSDKEKPQENRLGLFLSLPEKSPAFFLAPIFESF